MKEDNAYILGTDHKELHRLGLQHQVWASETTRSWETAQFSEGQTLLDLGSGPGFCSKELAYITGAKGKVIAVDQSKHYIDFLNQIAQTHQLNIETMLSNFDDMKLTPNSLDGMYCRWALAWLSDPKKTLSKVFDALKPNGKMVIHEYYNWSTHQTEPQMEGLAKAIGAALKSFKDSPNEIDIGRFLPSMLTDLGMTVTHVRPIIKLATPKDMSWHWPKSFYHSYFPRLVEYNYLTTEEVKQALDDIETLESIPGATLNCPMMVEVIAEKK